ncbi:hypothetical protein Bsph_4581 [Lysinibacillus sphaericus C3-41]|uniref:Uncharacterized protein n=1 Tax=Lysinibacillus sphaericus (strain C3-41) TaxID=444177 RepID=B1HMU7_LYSSC|nr:hypothetical protein Bsph_4581 [Lysinibacillus sphaericus C3-41]
MIYSTTGTPASSTISSEIILSHIRATITIAFYNYSIHTKRPFPQK